MPEPDSLAQPEYVPTRHERIAAGMHTHIADAVKWVLEPELLAVEAEVERRLRAEIAQDLRRAAKGRRHYAKSWPPGQDRDHLESEAQAFDSAARVAEGDRHTMCALLPVAMWTDAEHALGQGGHDA
jgi:hypothetical protein